jgi:hypothetical protein
MKLSTFGVVVLATSIAGCATPYQAKSFSGGYTDTRISKDTVLVSFKGNGYTSKVVSVNWWKSI